ncbi:putative bifunctional UDP-N-acetylglucosamine transferase and deubiquitinase ALG13 [Bombyx mandarina]|uniref:Bifunctional UDP-N-acetylglucosamine transferase and deubiquitinase ALG13 n=1 Tax=Bombyx mandarina TaxID=7092 RepID=A0A6J2KN96_BOMMA|nr:putative bifunctional UDP-N-acetylglucosamine transferase and deubiquitinase ALG13 [Bombyx mandarina]
MSSPIRCRGSWKIQKRASDPDRWLDEMGFFRKHTARDSSCLFRAVSESVYNSQRYFHKVRLECVRFMAANRHLIEGSLNCPFETYLKEMSNPSESGGLIEISAMSHLYRRDFVIFEANKGPQIKITNGYNKTIYLYYSIEMKHFDVIYTKDFINNSSFCQSLVYEILYSGVYQLQDLAYAVDKMLHDKTPMNHIEYFMSENVERRRKQKERAKIYIEADVDEKDNNNNTLSLKCKHHTKDAEQAGLLKDSLSIFVFNRSLIQLENVCLNCLNINSAKDLFDNGITPFPYKVAKALDPDIYRNIEFDVWSEMRRELRYGPRYSDGTTLQVGVKCLCKLESEQPVPFHCHIQEMRPDGGPCLVFIEELGEKRLVNYEQLEPLPLEQVRPWAPPYRYCRANSQLMNISQMLQQIGNMKRKNGIGKPRKSKDDVKSPDKGSKSPKIWTVTEETDITEYLKTSHTPYMDYYSVQPIPVEVQAYPLMVDCRPGAGAPPHELPHPAPNGAPPDNHHNQQQQPPQQPQQQAGGSGDMGTHNVSSPAIRVSTPATNTTALATYAGGMGTGGYGMCAPYMCGVKPVMWSPAPPAAAAPLAPPGPLAPLAPPPPPLNPHVYKSVQPNGSDLPMNDIPTLRYYYNLGVECMWAAYGPPPPPPPRHYSPRDLAHDMQQMSMHDRGMNHNADQNHKHKGGQGNDKPPMNNQGKGNGQRPLLGPRFKRGGNNHDGNQNSNHQNKGHNNNMGKGPNNRRNSQAEVRGPTYSEECGSPLPYSALPLPYPAPALYPLHYYPVEHDPAMMGMMGVGYMGYEETVEYSGMPYYQPPYPHPPPPPHMEHK